jgi:hypothetical protein
LRTDSNDKGNEQASDRGTMIAAVEISHHLSSDYWQSKFPSIPHLQREEDSNASNWQTI